jgi:hypothetical protein
MTLAPVEREIVTVDVLQPEAFADAGIGNAG